MAAGSPARPLAVAPGPARARAAAREERVDLRRFVTDLILAGGGIVDAPEEDILHVALPPELARRLALPEFAVLAFDSEAAKETPEAEFVTFGSPVLDRLVSLGTELGRVTREFAVVPSVRIPPNLMDRIEARIGFNRSKRPILRATSIETYERAVFRFVVSYIADERFVEPMTVAVDAATLADDTDLLDEAKGVYFSPEPLPGTRGAPDAPGPPKEGEEGKPGLPVVGDHRPSYREVVAKALTYLQARVRPRLAFYQAEVRGYCEKELVKVLGYYERTLAELAARKDAAAGDPEKAARLAAKLEASRLDRERRIADVVGKYKVTAKARLDSVILQVMPRVKALLEVEHKDTVYTQPVYYNLATNAVEPLACPRCGRRFFSAYPAPDGVFVCRPEEAG